MVWSVTNLPIGSETIASVFDHAMPNHFGEIKFCYDLFYEQLVGRKVDVQEAHELVDLLVLLGRLPVDVCEHEADVAGEEVVHLVAEAGLAQQLGAPDEVADGHVEVGVAAGPVGDPRKRMRHKHLLYT